MSNWTEKRVEDWAKEHFANTPVSGVWAPEGTGLIFLKTDERKWELVRAVDLDATKDTLSGIRALMFDLGYSLNEDNVEWDAAPETMEDALAIEESQKQDIANSWADEDGTQLIEMNPEGTFPRFIGMRGIQSDKGDTKEVELWTYPLLNPNTGEEVELDPDDYRMLTNDKCFMRYKNSEGAIFQVLTRKEMMTEGDKGDYAEGELVGSRDRDTGEKVPSWLWGTYCKRVSMNDV